MRKINNLVLHCTATPQTTSVQSIQNYWRAPKPHGLGWKQPGYHIIIKPDGSIVELLPFDQVSNGVQGHNHDSINISYIGGVDKNKNAIDNRTPQQIETMIRIIKEIKKQFPGIQICGHRDFPGVSKECPSFDAANWLKSVGLL